MTDDYDDIEIGFESEEELESLTQGSGLLPSGFYRAKIEDIECDVNNNGNLYWKIVWAFKVRDNFTIWDFLYFTDKSAPMSAKKIVKMHPAWHKYFFKPYPEGKFKPKKYYTNFIGHECIVEVGVREYKTQDGETRKINSIKKYLTENSKEFAGITLIETLEGSGPPRADQFDDDIPY